MGYMRRKEGISQISDLATNRFAKTQIMYKAPFGYIQAKEYLNFIIEDGDLLYCDSLMGRFNTAEKRLRFLELYNKVGEVKIMNEEPQQEEEARQQRQMFDIKEENKEEEEKV